MNAGLIFGSLAKSLLVSPDIKGPKARSNSGGI